MNPKKDFRNLFRKVLGVDVEIEGTQLTPEELERKNFILFIENYQKAIIRSVEVEDKYNLDLWSWDDMYAKALEGLINFTFDELVAELILWFVYEQHLAEDENDLIVTDLEGNKVKIQTAGELYDFIIKLEIKVVF
jgi:hypothetical protein